ncbi:hypothetical protein JK358_35360 [Nocardia sp. 2]|uniref:Transmembrane protein n=1 Tax=Nocardia acididurans TaxID=2802282 RepID=A0ABS1MGA9_9NOCA|nr:hypothetical protein [Nocardia acididurans]MBL1079696.1 hypothetical protein [Nocardia acididurans]
MTWSRRIRQWHRWLAVVFLATVVFTTTMVAVGGPEWAVYVPLPPLALLLVSGLSMAVRWYRTGRHRKRAAAGWVRPVHRWAGIMLAVTVLATFVALSLPDPLVWVSYLPLPPLAVLAVTGTVMLVRPHLAKRRTARAALA